MDWTRRTVNVPGLELAVFEAGDRRRRTVIMVHGWPDTHHLWNGVAEHLVDKFHVVAYDTRGMGESGDPIAVDGFSLRFLADDFFAVADEVSPDRPVHVLAHDWGSVEVWEAVCRPEAEGRISSFVSMSGPSMDHVSRWMRGAVRSREPGPIGSMLKQAAASSYMAVFVSPLGPWAVGRFDRDRWERFLQRTEHIEPAPEHHGDTLPQDMVSGLRIYKANVFNRLSSSGHKRTSVPVLQLVATKDRAITRPLLDASKPWVDNLEQVELPYGHWVVLRRPDLVAAEAARFIEGTRTAS